MLMCMYVDGAEEGWLLKVTFQHNRRNIFLVGNIQSNSLLREYSKLQGAGIRGEEHRLCRHTVLGLSQCSTTSSSMSEVLSTTVSQSPVISEVWSECPHRTVVKSV